MDSLGIRICRRMDKADFSPFWEERSAIVHSATSHFGREDSGHDVFGGMPTTAVDVINLIKAGDYRVQQMGKGFGEFSAVWAKKDPGAFADFSNDWMSLIGRWALAKVAAKSVGSMLSSALAGGATGGLSGGAAAQQAHDGLVKALRQGGADAPIHRGDFDDLLARIYAAGGSVDIAHASPLTPTLGAIVTSPGTAVPQALREIEDIPSQLGRGLGLPDPFAGFKSLEDVLKWLKAHQTELMIGAVAVGGLMLLGVLFTAVKAAPLALKGATMGAL